MDKTKSKKRADDGKSSVQVRIDKGLLGRSRAYAKDQGVELDDVANKALRRLVDPPLHQANPTVPQISADGLNPGTAAEAKDFCARRGWTLEYLINRSLIKELERSK